MADGTPLSRHERQRRRAVRRERPQISQFRDLLTKIPPTLESVTAGSTVSRSGNAVLGPASSRLKIPELVPDNWEQGLELADDSIDSDDGGYEGQSPESLESQESPESPGSQESPECQGSQESQEENKLEQHVDDKHLFADWVGHKGRSGMRSVTRKI